MFKHDGVKKALLIGNTYRNNPKIYLKYVREDIRRMNILLKILGFKENNIEKHIDVNAKNVLEKFISKIQNNDLICIFYSGHGGRFVKSTNLPREIGLLSSWINNDSNLTLSYEVDKILSDIQKKCKIILICDSCYSGYFTDYYNGKNPIYFLGASKNYKTSNYKCGDNKSGGLIILLEYLVNNSGNIEFNNILENTYEYRNKKSFLKLMVAKSKNA